MPDRADDFSFPSSQRKAKNMIFSALFAPAVNFLNSDI
ncbi:hypothetical protein D1BOALGB6SA_10460 [Olavius sp. associated proteobacterium Delta 1]|nr:hypothetical protein D1BOALGB6SA_10460 [Olavius sp. associated proteobacterium Delta 1]